MSVLGTLSSAQVANIEWWLALFTGLTCAAAVAVSVAGFRRRRSRAIFWLVILLAFMVWAGNAFFLALSGAQHGYFVALIEAAAFPIVLAKTGDSVPTNFHRSIGLWIGAVAVLGMFWQGYLQTVWPALAVAVLAAGICAIDLSKQVGKLVGIAIMCLFLAAHVGLLWLAVEVESAYHLQALITVGGFVIVWMFADAWSIHPRAA